MSDKDSIHMVNMEAHSDASSILPPRKSHSIGGETSQQSGSANAGDDSLQGDETGTEYPTLWKTILILSGLFMGMFLVALDQTIIGTAIPKITVEFKTIQVPDTQLGAPLLKTVTLVERFLTCSFLQDVGWYGSAYFLTSTGESTTPPIVPQQNTSQAPLTFLE